MSNDSPHKEAPSQGEAGLEPEVLNSTPDTLGLVVAEMMKEENRDRQLAINVSEEARKIDPDLLASTVALHKFFSPRLGKDSQGRDRVVLLMPEHEHGDKSDRELKIGSRYGSILPVSKD